MEKFVRRIRSSLSEVADAAAAAEAYCAGRGAEEGQRLRIGLALDELAANALVHGTEPDREADILLEVWTDEEMAHLRVTARGPCFDPRERAGVGPGSDWSLGGRGLAMVLDFADRIDHEWRAPMNVTTFSVYMNARTRERGGDGA